MDTSDRARPCIGAQRRPVCTSCAAPLSLRIAQKIVAGIKTSGLCKACYYASVRVERRCCECGATLSKIGALRCHSCNNRRMAADAAREARRIARARAAHQRPEVRARHDVANRKIADRKLIWCPDELRGEYRRLVKRRGRTEARAQIMARLTPFERKLALVREGSARLVPNVRLGMHA